MGIMDDDGGLGYQAKVWALSQAVDGLLLRLLDGALTRDAALDVMPERERRECEKLPPVDIVDIVADFLGVPAELVHLVPPEMKGEAYCRDFLYDTDDMTADQLLALMVQAAKDGDRVTTERARKHISTPATSRGN